MTLFFENAETFNKIVILTSLRGISVVGVGVKVGHEAGHGVGHGEQRLL